MKTEIVDVVIVIYVVQCGLKGWERGEGVRIKGGGSCHQAKD
jgi:hypothetical protein